MSEPSVPAVGSRWWSVTTGRVAIVERVELSETTESAHWICYRFEKAFGKTGRVNSRGRRIDDFFESFKPVEHEAVRS